MKTLNEMTQKEFTEAFLNASENELVTENISKKWSCEEGGYWYAANEGDCDGGDILQYWYGLDADDNGYVAELDARI